MPIFVDDMRAKYGRYIFCHMIAHTDAELHAMADRIGVARRWHQKPPKASSSHYDIALVKRALAVAAGAIEITWRDASLMTFARRRDPDAPLLTVEQGLAYLEGAYVPHVTVTSLLLWVEKGNHTRDQANRRGKDEGEAWITCLRSGWIRLHEDGLVKLTGAGERELGEQRLRA